MCGILCGTHTHIHGYAYEGMHLDEFMYVGAGVCASLFADAVRQCSVCEIRRRRLPSAHTHLHSRAISLTVRYVRFCCHHLYVCSCVCVCLWVGKCLLGLCMSEIKSRMCVAFLPFSSPVNHIRVWSCDMHRNINTHTYVYPQIYVHTSLETAKVYLPKLERK